MDALVPEGATVALLDYPNHPNVGDSAIWLGELEYLRRRHCQVAYRSDLASHDTRQMLRRIPPDGLVLFHGGGNLGDLWPAHQRFREQVLRECPRLRFVIFPQTVNFCDSEALRRARLAFTSHDRLTIVTRDTQSHSLARTEFDCDVRLCPDSAFWLDPTCPAETWASRDVVWLARTDTEARRAGGDRHSDLAAPVDWLDASEGSTVPQRVRYNALRHLSRVTNRLPGGPRRAAAALQQSLFNPVSRAHLARGTTLLGSGQVVITDRLHAHILSVLLGIPHFLIDDRHLKVRNFWNTWTSDMEGIEWASTMDEALELAMTTLRNDPDDAGASTA